MLRVHLNEKVRGTGPLRLGTVAAAALLGLALAAASGAQAGLGVLAPGLTIGTVTVDGDTARVTGDIEGLVAGSQLTINGNAVLLEDSGAFTTLVDLNGAAALELGLAGLRGEKTAIRVPVRVVLAKNGKGVLDDLRLAGISLDVPGDGFTLVDGAMPHISGSVLRPEHLASLTVNGREALRLVGPGGRFVVTNPPSSRGGSSGGGSPGDVTVRAVDRQGVSQTTVFRTTRLTTAIRTLVGTSISAVGARGIRIAALRFNATRVLSDRRLAVVVTVKDRRGYLVRGAAVHVLGMPQRHIANGPAKVGFTNRFGKVRVTYALRKSALSGSKRKAFTALARASTPSSRASSWGTRRLPLAWAR